MKRRILLFIFASALCSLPHTTLATGRVTISDISTNTTEAGGTATFTIQLDEPIITPDPEDPDTVTIPISSTNTSEGTVYPSEVVFHSDSWFTPQTVTVTGVDDYRDDGPIAYAVDFGEITSASEYYNNYRVTDVVYITNEDNDTAAVNVETTIDDMSEAGDTSEFVVLLDSQPTDDVTVTLTPDDALSLDRSTLIFTPDNWNDEQAVTVSTIDDDLYEGRHVADVSFFVSSEDDSYDQYIVDDLALTIQDNDVASEPEDTDEDAVDEVTLTSNGKYIWVLVNDVKVEQKKVGKKTLDSKYYILKQKKFFADESFSNVLYLRVGQHKAKLVVFQLTANNELKKKDVVKFDIEKRRPIKLKLNTSKKRIKAIIGEKKSKVSYRFKLLPKNLLRSL